ncbi:MAG: [Fe-Fe] hydrogenase large subunit C-terminal domain-containing protein, partial [Patescibacteria group bacterium]|nr:[Fe-Fe] hydrogenase large subunit C-terminal domain-containing protein [Patescibacteria group bacterium]
MEVTAYITTVKERCRMCYTCVRECPAKAIRISTGQAEVMPERCIACGNCVRVCSQEAKQPVTSIDAVEFLLASERPVAACLAPSFPAEFSEIDYRRLVGMVRELGFRWVLEVSFGADLVARQYRELLAQPGGHRYIATNCPAIIGYVERYHPELIDCLAPIVSPMIAAARVARQAYGPSIGVVFIGPCIAKKAEADSRLLTGEVNAVLTFTELREMFHRTGAVADTIAPSEFDPPFGGIGGVFPVGRGMLQAADIAEDLMTGEVVATQGRAHVLEAIKEFANGQLGAKLLEALCCEGCIMGAGIASELPLFGRRRQVRQYVCERMELLDQSQWREELERCEALDLTRGFEINDQRIPTPQEVEFLEVMARMGKFTPQDELNCGACGYDTCREHAIAICKGLAENEMCLPHTIEQLRRAVKEVEASNRQLAETQEALMQSEKLASMGQLAAGIAHEVNNPLGVVLMYAHLLLDSCEQGSPFRDDLVMIAEQADRCKKIVAGLLHFARQNKVARYPADLREVV